ncbi:sulfatase-like hydrolase/transferase [Halorubellus litoreus]|uniref:Sulfatase-like hydrolase/transferase n=1 Tax=Halorubellus litoreus TaxID=755308 RepID=A0ABD5VFJ0_9EURY
MQTELGAALADLSVSNVYIYVGDAVRWDSLPDAVSARGTTVHTIASSIHSPTSFASMVTGRYPPSTGVFSFTDTIGDTFSLFDLDGYETGFRNSIQEDDSNADPIFDVLNVGRELDDGPLSSVSEPFVVMERGPGGHAPYGYPELTAEAYFDRYGSQSKVTIRADYERAVSRDAALFQERLDTLAERDLRADTLVIYTSDHGELLGEGGQLGHNGPVRQELVSVPTVFAHPELDDDTAEELFRHVDVLPTVLDVLGVELSEQRIDGQSRLAGTSPRFGLSFYTNDSLPSSVPGISGTVSYESAFDADGGYVFTESKLRDRLALLAGKCLRSPKREFLRRHLPAAVCAYARGDVTYGTPGFAVDEAEDGLSAARESARTSDSIDLDEDAEEHLRDLGYL